MKITKSYLREVIMEELQNLDENWITSAGSALDNTVGKFASNVGSGISKVGGAVAKGARLALGSNENVGQKEKKQLVSLFSSKIPQQIEATINNLKNTSMGYSPQSLHISLAPIYKDISAITDQMSQAFQSKGMVQEAQFFKNLAGKVQKGLQGAVTKLGGQSDSQTVANAQNWYSGIDAFLKQLTQIKNQYDRKDTKNFDGFTRNKIMGELEKLKNQVLPALVKQLSAK